MAWSTGSSHCQRVGCANGGRGNRVKGRSYAIQQIIDQFTHGPDGVTKRQFFGAPKKQAALDIARQRERQLCIDAELPMLGDTVAQAASEIGRAPCRERVCPYV